MLLLDRVPQEVPSLPSRETSIFFSNFILPKDVALVQVFLCSYPFFSAFALFTYVTYPLMISLIWPMALEQQEEEEIPESEMMEELCISDIVFSKLYEKLKSLKFLRFSLTWSVI